MSASLVGSEMCIRDSLAVAPIDPRSVRFATRFDRYSVHVSSTTSLHERCLLYTSDAADDM
eukprot:1472160-Alexandrium_andersonii.AAC.1